MQSAKAGTRLPLQVPCVGGGAELQFLVNCERQRFVVCGLRQHVGGRHCWLDTVLEKNTHGG